MYRLFLVVVLCSLPLYSVNACFPFGSPLSHIHGRVIDDNSHSSVPDVKIFLVADNGGVMREALCNIVTDSDGHFDLVMPAGKWIVGIIPNYPVYDWEYYDNARNRDDETIFDFVGGEDVNLGEIGIGPPPYQILNAVITKDGAKIHIHADIANNTTELTNLYFWAIVQEKPACEILCGQGMDGMYEPHLSIESIAAAPGRTTVDAQFTPAKAPPAGKKYLVTLYAGVYRWVASAHSLEHLEFQGM